MPTLLLGQSNTEGMVSRMHYQLTLSLLSTMTPRSFSAALLSSQSNHQQVPLQGFSHCNSSCRTWHLSSLNSIRFLLSHSSSLSTFHWTEAMALNILTPPPTLGSLTNLMRAQNILYGYLTLLLLYLPRIKSKRIMAYAFFC